MVERSSSGPDPSGPVFVGSGATRAGWLIRAARQPLEFPGARRRRRKHLIESLNQVAAAISSTMSTAEVLRTVVDEAKQLVGTDKAVLCLLTESGPDLAIDDRAIFVRGRRDQYPEEWWRVQIQEVAASAMAEQVPVVVSRGDATLMTVPVKIKSRPIGVLSAINPRTRGFDENQVALMAILGAFAGVAIENARLHSQSHYALLADERSRIAKEMHDGLSQSLFSASLEIDVLRKRISAHPDEAERRLERIQSILVRSLAELRRYIYDLRPVSLDKLGLIGAIDMRVKEIAETNGIKTRLYAEGDERPLPPGVEACLYRVAQEAITNVAKHAEASRVVVVLKYRQSGVTMIVEDDGHGFDVAEAVRRVELDESIGMNSMRDRVAAEGGRFDVSSHDRGTVVTVDLPC
jgi:signal transduction histidine kinase